jgi:hypothetical protein
MTRTEAIDATRRLWTWLADTGDVFKYNWPGWVNNGGNVPNCRSDCPCCQYAYQESHREFTILEQVGLFGKNLHWKCQRYCPIDWPGKTRICTDRKSPYYRWRKVICPSERQLIAKQIANLPERKIENDTD